MIALARDRHPDQAYTIGWSTPTAAPTLIDQVNLVTYHDYEPAAKTAQRLAAVQAQAQGKPVLITEIGHTSWRGIPLIAGSSATQQARELQRRLAGLKAAQGVYIWTLHDFANLDSAAIGGTFINRNRQRRFGLYDVQGSEKPAAHVARAAFQAGGPIP